VTTAIETIPSAAELDALFGFTAEAKLYDGDPIFPEIDDGHGRSRGCMWEYSICTDSPTHHITYYTDKECTAKEAILYCGKHYAAALARFALVHPVESHCHAPITTHLAGYGAI